jgi:hypothetical protein
VRRARGSAIHAQLFILEELILEMLGDGFRHGLNTMGAGVAFLNLICPDHSTIVHSHEGPIRLLSRRFRHNMQMHNEQLCLGRILFQ